MNLQVPADIEASVRAFVASGRYGDEVEVLRKALAVLDHYEQDVAAIQEGIDDMEAGRYRPWEDVKAELDAKFGFGNR
ncbi:MAG TPA: type II toxin-antitoxin system ParD family antitoxin [Lacipirellula sp.]